MKLEFVASLAVAAAALSASVSARDTPHSHVLETVR